MIVKTKKEFIDALMEFDGEAKFYIYDGEVHVIDASEYVDLFCGWDYAYSDEIESIPFDKLALHE